MSKSHQLGRWGESFALSFLEMCGYTSLQNNYRKQGGEIDLIVRRGNTVVFVEVKTRGCGRLARPEAWVDRRKLYRMRKTARLWLQDNPGLGTLNFRFDVVAVEFSGSGSGVEVRHLEAVQ